MLRATCPLKTQAHNTQALAINTHNLVLTSTQNQTDVEFSAATGGKLSLIAAILPGGFLPLTVNGRHVKISILPGWNQ